MGGPQNSAYILRVVLCLLRSHDVWILAAMTVQVMGIALIIIKKIEV